MDLQSHLSYKVKNTENVFSFKRIENVNKVLHRTKAWKSISLGRTKNWKTCNHYSQENVSSWSCTYCIDEDKACITSSRYWVQIQCEGSKDFTSMENFIGKCLKNFIVWLDRGAVRRTLPKCFEKKFRDCIYIRDCSEIFIERAKNLTARAQTWSNHKHNNTIKYLVGLLQLVWWVFFNLDGVDV